jgi:hypothetical protein
MGSRDLDADQTGVSTVSEAPHDKSKTAAHSYLGEGTPHGDQPVVEKGGPDDQRGRLIGRTKGGMNTKLHSVTDAEGRPLRFFMTAGQVSDYTGAAALLGSLPKAKWLLAPFHGLRANHRRATDRGCDADWFREALKDKGIKPCIPGRQ